MFVVYTIIAMVHMIYIMMLEYDNVEMLNAMLVAKGTYIHTKHEYTVGFNLSGCVYMY